MLRGRSSREEACLGEMGCGSDTRGHGYQKKTVFHICQTVCGLVLVKGSIVPRQGGVS